jgi:hypothetical protein
MTHGIESPSRYVLLVEWESVSGGNQCRVGISVGWESVQAHEENTGGTERFTAWRAAIGPFFAHRPVVEHFPDI